MSLSRQAAIGADSVAPGPRAVPRPAIVALLGLAAATAACRATTGGGSGPAEAAGAAARTTPEQLVTRYCLDCHDGASRKGDLDLQGVDLTAAATAPALRERVVRKLRHRQMPPPGEERPDEATYDAVAARLEAALDREAVARPHAGRVDAIRRLTRTEYGNAVRDLLALDVDATALLPNDEPSHGFDNVAVSNLSPTLLERYVGAAQKIARLAIGAGRPTPRSDTFRVPPDLTQEGHVEGLPLGTRGGAVFAHVFPQDGQYDIQVRLARDRNEHVEGLKKPHEIELLIDRERVGLFTVSPPGADKNFEAVDAHLKLRVKVAAGPHRVAATFPKDPSLLIETERQPFIARFNMHRHPRTAPALYQLSITGPFDATGPGASPSRRRIFGDVPLPAASAPQAEREARARQILTPLLRRAFRRPITDQDLRRPLQFFREGAAGGAGFEAGIENALAAILVSPRFLLRTEEDPASPPGKAVQLSDLELASRLSFFLWSSIPDDALIEAAVRGDLRRPALRERQVRRMLADPRAGSLVTNFASQWLQLRKLDSITPDARLFPNFDDNLRQALRRETELFVESVLREDRSVADLLCADYSFINERLARHYGVPHVQGSRFRRVSFAGDPQRQRGGLLRQGSILTITSYATRTSPVIRGHFILANIVGEPTPPPPPDAPPLDENTVSAGLPMRERLAAHRDSPACARCHRIMDPVGFSLENFDAVGRWRAAEDQRPIDATGGLPDGSSFVGVAALEHGLCRRPELLAATVSEKLLTFALGRGVELADGPTIRTIVRRARTENHRLSALILGVVDSVPFQMRTAP
jgi:mono/diheme cytochrome c family protein